MLRNGGYSLRSIYETLLHISRLTSPLNALINTLRCVRKIAIAIISFIMAVRLSARNNSAPTGRILMKFDTSGFFFRYVVNIQFSLRSDRNNGYFT